MYKDNAKCDFRVLLSGQECAAYLLEIKKTVTKVMMMVLKMPSCAAVAEAAQLVSEPSNQPKRCRVLLTT